MAGDRHTQAQQSRMDDFLHDFRPNAVSKLLFSHPRTVADLLRLLGEPWVDDLDLDRLARLPAGHVADSHRTRRQEMP